MQVRTDSNVEVIVRMRKEVSTTVLITEHLAYLSTFTNLDLLCASTGKIKT